MPNETNLPPLSAVETEERRETIPDADQFCLAFGQICGFERQIVAALINANPDTLRANVITRHLDQQNAPTFLENFDRFLNSDENKKELSRLVGEHGGDSLIKDEYMFSYLAELARKTMLGGMVDAYLEDLSLRPQEKKEYKIRLIESNHSFRNLVDSRFGRQLGFTRRHLKTLINNSLGLDETDESKLSSSLEAGITAEIATKRYIEHQGLEAGIAVRYSTDEEDAKKIDVVCSQSGKKLGIDVKSSDKNSGPGGEPRAHFSPIEEYDLHEYRVRELYPAVHTAIGDNFEIKACSYRQVIDEILAQFHKLD